jgi:hypothetical protein
MRSLLPLQYNERSTVRTWKRNSLPSFLAVIPWPVSENDDEIIQVSTLEPIRFGPFYAKQRHTGIPTIRADSS